MTIDYVEHGPHLRRRLIISIGFVALLIALVIGWGGGGDPSTLAAPRAPQVRPGVGSLIVSWSPPSGYATASEAEVRSYPADRACTMDGPERCTMSGVDDATPWQFSVRELIANSWTAWSARSTTVPHASIAIVAGQSNATGWESTVIDAHGKNVLTESSSPADAVVSIAWDQPNSVIPTKAGLGAAVPVPLLSDQTLSNASWPSLTGKKIFGPEISMARELSAAGVKNLVVLKVTEGGTALGGGGPWNPSDGMLYKALIANAHELQAWEAGQGRSASISMLTWYQGESDALDGLGPSYEANLTALITSLRQDLPTNASTPIILVKPSVAAAIDFQQRTGVCQPAHCEALRLGDAQVRAADDAVALALPSVYVVDSVYLDRTGIGIHLSNSAELELGSLIAKSALQAGLT